MQHAAQQRVHMFHVACIVTGAHVLCPSFEPDFARGKCQVAYKHVLWPCTRRDSGWGDSAQQITDM